MVLDTNAFHREVRLMRDATRQALEQSRLEREETERLVDAAEAAARQMRKDQLPG